MKTRRAFLGLSLAASVAGVALYSQTTPGLAGETLSPDQAHSRARAGTLTLIDIRRPEEWADTGIAAGAHPLDLRRRDFVADLARIAPPDTPIALICARGVRSAQLAAQLRSAGFSAIIDVPEGMLGSAAGPGWIARGLPLTRP